MPKNRGTPVVMEAETAEAAKVGYEAYRQYDHGKHPATGMPLPPFAGLSPAVREAWGRAATALKVYYRNEK